MIAYLAETASSCQDQHFTWQDALTFLAIGLAGAALLWGLSKVF